MRIPPAARFAAACLLFAGWMAYLICLAAADRPIVLSRPQLLVSEIDVVAEIDSLDKPVTVEEVVYTRIKDKDVKPGATLPIANLKDCKRLPREGEDPATVPLDWTGPGKYLLPLRTTNDGKSYFVVETPSSAGFPPRGEKGTPRIYPAKEVLHEYQKFRGTP